MGITSLPDQVAELAKDWRQLNAGHMVVAVGCSCGFPSAHISIADLESDLLDYLRGRYFAVGTCDRAKIANCSSILELLNILEEPEFAPQAVEVTSSLRRTLDSFRQTHRGRAVRSALGGLGSSSAF